MSIDYDAVKKRKEEVESELEKISTYEKKFKNTTFS